MPAVESMEDFMRAVDEFMTSNPDSTRVCLKYRHCDSKLSMKVTDDRNLVQYKTTSLQDVKKVEKLTSQTIRTMASNK